MHAESVLDRRALRWALLGVVLGAAAGGAIGTAFGLGRLAVPGLAPLAAAGTAASAFVFASAAAALLGLLGALAGTARGPTPREAAQAQPSPGPHGPHESHGGAHAKGALIARLPVYGALVLGLCIAVVLLRIAARALGQGEPSDQTNRVTWDLKNATRVGGSTDEETALHALQIAFPATQPDNTPCVVIETADDWRLALAAAPLIARPSNAAVLAGTLGNRTENLAREVSRLLAGRSPSSPSSCANAPEGLPLPILQAIPLGDPAAVAAGIDTRRSTGPVDAARAVMIVAADADSRWSLPAAAYAARTGTPILFVTKDGVPEATTSALARRGGQARLFVLGPARVIPERVLDELRRSGAVTRIEGADPAKNAVRFAEFQDEAATFGWRHGPRGRRQRTGANTILVHGDRWQDGVMAAHLARAGRSGPLLLTGGATLGATTDRHLWAHRPAFAETPAEGPFNHVWVVGSLDRIPFQVQAWADYSQEISQYKTLGDSALSGFEAFATGWIFFSFASAIWIAFHASRRLPDVMPSMKAAWAVFALLLGPIALVLYVKSYHHRERATAPNDMVEWRRPAWAQAVSATVMMFGFDMALMVLAVFALAGLGFPIIPLVGPFYWLGTSMFLMMVLMFVVAFVATMFVFHAPMTMHERNIQSYWRAFWVGLPIMAATMAIESVGMMPTMWWAQMSFLPGMEMPTEDDATMWATLIMAVVVGFLVVLPFNYRLVKRGRKMGTM
jgi:hypothetical protein